MMRKDDNPPPYEDALHRPFYGKHPQLGPPPPAYTPGPAVYAGQPGYYPQGGYYSPGPSGRHTPVISTLSAGLPPAAPADLGGFMASEWDSTSIRHGFIRKVYLILAAQLSITLSVVAVFTFVEPVKLFVVRYPGIYWASFVVFFMVYCILVCCNEPRRQFPCNLVLLGVFTLALSYMSGTISSYYDTKAVVLAIGITAVVCVCVTIFCFQTKVDFTSCGGVFCVLAVMLVIISIVTAIVLSFKYIPWLHMLYAAIGAVVYTLFLAYNTQLLIGNREVSISPEEYIFGALSLYIDIVQIFLFILQMSGAGGE